MMQHYRAYVLHLTPDCTCRFPLEFWYFLSGFSQRGGALFGCLLFYWVVSKHRLSRSIFQLSLSLKLWPFQVYISLGLKLPMMSSGEGTFLERCSAQHNVSTLAWVSAGFNKDMLKKHTHNGMRELSNMLECHSDDSKNDPIYFLNSVLVLIQNRWIKSSLMLHLSL